MPHPATSPPAAPGRHPLGRLERDAAGRLFSPALRARVAHLGAHAVRVEAFAALASADKMVTLALERGFEPLRLSVAQCKALAWIRHAGRGGAQMHRIAEACAVTPRTMTGVVDGLEAAGLVERVADPADRRAVIARLTAAGERRHDAAVEIQTQVTERLLSRFEDEECAVLRDLSLRLVESAAMEVQR